MRSGILRGATKRITLIYIKTHVKIFVIIVLLFIIGGVLAFFVMSNKSQEDQIPLSTTAMESDTFWNIIEQSKAQGCEEQVENIRKTLSQLDPQTSIAFQEKFEQLMNESYRWDLWQVAYIINGGASDDGFAYFRAWLIGQGKERFENALAKSESVGDWTEPGNYYECESLWYVGSQAYEEKTGEEYPSVERETSTAPKGNEWNGSEEELESLYPELAKKFDL